LEQVISLPFLNLMKWSIFSTMVWEFIYFVTNSPFFTGKYTVLFGRFAILGWGIIAVKIKVNGGSSLDYLLKLVDTVILKYWNSS